MSKARISENDVPNAPKKAPQIYEKSTLDLPRTPQGIQRSPKAPQAWSKAPFFQKMSFRSVPKWHPIHEKSTKFEPGWNVKNPVCNAIQTGTPASKQSASKPYSEQASKSASQQVSEPVSQRASKPASQQPAADSTEGAGGRGEALG